MMKIVHPISEIIQFDIPRISIEENENNRCIQISFLDSIYPAYPISINNYYKDISKNLKVKKEKKEIKNEKKEPKLKQNNETKVIKINRDNPNVIFFFVRSMGRKFKSYEEKKDTKIKKVIEDYIKEINGKPELKYTFSYEDNIIDNLESTIEELKIKNLGFVLSSES